MHPILAVGPLEISSWRLAVLGGLLLCWGLLLKRAARLGLPAVPVLAFLVIELGVGTAGGHLLNLLIPLVFRSGEASLNGLTVIGSLLATLAFAGFYLPRVVKTPALPFLDAAAFTMPLELFIGRIGCLLNGCCFGKPAPDWAARSPLGLFTIGAERFTPFSPAGQFVSGLHAGGHLWNLPFLLMVNALAVLAVAEWLYRNKTRLGLPPGAVLFAAVAQDSAGRFLLEFLRQDETVGRTLFNPWQLSVALMGAGFFAALCVSLSKSRGRPA